tara:strand:- start:1349 stop:1948 length:600 start_codon:yes stop_codon:yes gene_type:complete
MDLFQELVQKGGSDFMGLLNNQKGGAVQAVAMGFNVIFPLLFFGITKIVHDNLDEERAEADEAYDDDDDDDGSDDGDFDKREYVIWGLFDIKVNLLMMFICFIVGWVITWGWFSDLNKLLGVGGEYMAYWWKAVMFFMIVTHAWSIVFGGLRSTAAAYFYEDLWPNRNKMQNTCKAFGCGWAPHGSQTCERGIDYRAEL